ncbi:tetratricopeptide repeat protein [Bifidobacterium eulemuris]|uniref:Helicase n=1 Tax=Bifidobacterium eulemuris TaxID=1765219 RepID=A0A261GBW6_9BIFI|nr:hypothetical protein [Bifidobacterium eulemuris]OZG68918.1 helicase [Bifidobacterium eulemuris]QOL31544.1 hypothetical protein BE0216_03015 [Bifidobacterium eulemuris]
MTQDNNHGSRDGKSYGGNGRGRSYGNGGSRGGYGKSGSRGGKSYGGGRGGFRKDGQRSEGGYRKDGFRRDRDDNRDFRSEGGERREGGYRKNFHNDDRRGGYRKNDGFHKGGYRKDGYRNDRDRDFRRDGEGSAEGGERRDFNRGPRRDGERGGYRGNGRGGERGGYRGNGGYRGHRDGDNPRYQHGDKPWRKDGEDRGERRDGERRDYRRDGDRRDFRRDGERRNDRRDNRYGGDRRDNRYDRDRRDNRRGDNRRGERREFTPEERAEYRERKNREYMDRPRRNSDGTMSFPSQNPYTARRPGEPKMPKGMEWSMLSKDEKERLRGLAKEHAENIGLHILATYALIDDDPAAALEHAKWVARQASRIDFARETLAFVAYRMGDYKLALREFRTAFRMNGYPDYLPFIADCERGLGNPKKAIEMAVSDEAKMLRGDAKAEMFLVYAGALGDLELWDKAIEIAHTLGRSKGISGGYRMRAVQAEQLFLEEAGRTDEAAALDGLLDKLELQYADEELDEESDDVVIDHDLQGLTDDSIVLEKLGIDPSMAQYAPELEPEYGDDYEDGDLDDSDEIDEVDEDTDETDEVGIDAVAEDVEEGLDEPSQDDESELPAEEALEGVESDVEPAALAEGDADESADGAIEGDESEEE